MSTAQKGHSLLEGRVHDWKQPRGIAAVLELWEQRGQLGRMELDETLAPTPAELVDLPESLGEGPRKALAMRGIEQVYSHQAEAYELARAGRDVVVATPTASGKSLCYNLPILDRLASEPGARALFLFPTKALSRDQEASLSSFARDAGLAHGAITYDGDTPGDARRAARERTGLLLTNPDMLHAGILPHHANWARFFADLRFVVIDELHSYRGVFGSHLANVIRRLDRIARFHGAAPIYLLSSATIGNPREHASRIVGRDVALVDKSGAPAGSRRVLVHNPPVVNAELGIRGSYVKRAVRIAADLVSHGVPTLVFGNSRSTVEVMLKYLRDRLAKEKIPAEAIKAYRGGYLPKARRAIEAGLRDGSVRCVVATSALELGIDIGALDAVVCAGYPGTLAGTWQRFGRAGRRSGQSLSVLVTSSAPVDQYFAAAPRRLLEGPVEEARIDPDNVEILLMHLKCAAFELPFEEGERFGDLDPESAGEALDFLARGELLHVGTSPSGVKTWHWAAESYPAADVSLRSASWDNFVIIEVDQDITLAEMDWHSAHTMLHEQAIYQDDGAQYQVERLDYENHKAFVRKVAPDYYTTAMTHTRVAVIAEDESAQLALPGASLTAGLGEVSVVSKVVGYKKIKFHTHENVGYGDVHLPEIQMHTSGYWLTFPEDFVRSLEEPRALVIDALRGLGKAMQLVAAVGLMVDLRDLGRALGDRDEEGGPPKKGGGPGFDPTIFLYDSVPGGIGLAPRLYEEREALLRNASALVVSCPCDDGCPACIGPPVGEMPSMLAAGSLVPGGAQDVAQPLASYGRRARLLRILKALAVPSLH